MLGLVRWDQKGLRGEKLKELHPWLGMCLWSWKFAPAGKSLLICQGRCKSRPAHLYKADERGAKAAKQAAERVGWLSRYVEFSYRRWSFQP